MRDDVLRETKDRLLAPLAGRAGSRINPNWLSFAAMLVGMTAALAAWQQLYWPGLALWIANRVLDGLDGTIARMHNKQSDFGGYWDLMLDYVVYLAVPIGLVAGAPSPETLWAWGLLVSAYVINLASWSVLAALQEKRRAESAGRLTSIEMPGGLIEGTETIIFYALFFLLPGYLPFLFVVMAVLVLFTAGQRVWWAARHLR